MRGKKRPERSHRVSLRCSRSQTNATPIQERQKEREEAAEARTAKRRAKREKKKVRHPSPLPVGCVPTEDDHPQTACGRIMQAKKSAKKQDGQTAGGDNGDESSSDEENGDKPADANDLD